MRSGLDLMDLASIVKLGAMPHDMVERSMTVLGAEVVSRLRHLLDRNATGNRVAAKPARPIA
jgi:hypothetical protein